MKIACILRTSENRGDHAADVYKVVEVDSMERVGDLVDRLLGFESYKKGVSPPDKFRAYDHISTIELKVVVES